MAKKTTKEKIITAAIRLFSQKGYSGASTSEIAKEAECAEGTIFRYFPKKIDLLKHVASEFIKEFAGRIATKTLYEIIDKSGPMSAEELIEEVMHDRIALINENFELLKIVIYEINFHEEVRVLFFNELESNLENVGKRMADILSEKLNLKEIEANLILRTVIGQTIGILIQAQLLQRRNKPIAEDALNEMIRTSAQIIINGLKGM